jgi:hypothetical protein
MLGQKLCIISPRIRQAHRTLRDTVVAENVGHLFKPRPRNIKSEPKTSCGLWAETMHGWRFVTCSSCCSCVEDVSGED